MNSSLHLPLPVVYILHILKKNGFEAYIVGGAIRDLLLAAKSESPITQNFDFDFATNAQPEQIQQLFPESFYENDFGTVAISHQHLVEQLLTDLPQLQPLETQLLTTPSPKKVTSTRLIDIAKASKIHVSLLKTDQQNRSALPTATQTQPSPFPNFEITTYRSKELYTNFRKPDKLEWGSTIKQDLERRDFTINALALTIDQEILAQLVSTPNNHSPYIVLHQKEYQIIDEYHGLDDLANNVIKAVGNPNARFEEDALRMLRAIRFSVQLNMQIEDHTFEAILKHADLISHISWERIRDELLKIIKSNYPAEGIQLLDEAGLLQHILPELIPGKNVQQGGHHTTDVWTHSLDSLRECPSPDPIVRLATLLHDIAKPQTYKVINNTITFYNHEIIGSRMAKKIGQRLRLSKQQLDKIFILVRYHMFHYQPHNTDAAIRRFMRKVGLENIDDILDLREADRLGSGARRTSWRLEEMKQRMIDQLHQPMDVTDLAINGNDLITNLNLKPGPLLGKILNSLLEKVLENPDLNTKEQLLKEAATYISNL